ncbi:hypothetical protein HMN09_00929700 [Mycena chlorophos]|uniref:DUF6533 domain-containing protein n=1 Tax=Mycena chlorophos TaxID=658473 RepID=A0A8H6SK33_MYCCL|nr:hypothetical protein HMN09_00929700 [Mycena chlorophos]
MSLPSLPGSSATGIAEAALAQEAALLQVLISNASSILFARFFSAVAVASLFHDHALTFADEVELIWFNARARRRNRVGFLLNRYVTALMVAYVCYLLSGLSDAITTQECKTFTWVFAAASIGSVAGTHLVLMGRVYTLWEQRRTIKWILVGSFVTAIGIACLFFFLSAAQVQGTIAFIPVVNMCVFEKKPIAMDLSLGTLVVFDLFIVLLTVANNLHRPYKKEADVVAELVRDGALMFVALFGLRFINLVTGLVANPAPTFAIMIFIWSIASIVSSRMQLRMEALNLNPPDPRPGPISYDMYGWRPNLKSDAESLHSDDSYSDASGYSMFVPPEKAPVPASYPAGQPLRAVLVPPSRRPPRKPTAIPTRLQEERAISRWSASTEATTLPRPPVGIVKKSYSRLAGTWFP